MRFVTQNGLYDWGWLRADAGIAMPPSDRLEEIGALATMVDENRFSYSLDALCAWRGLPGKDETLLQAGGQGRGLQGQQEEPAAIAHLAIAGALCRTLCRGRCGEHARAIREPRSRSSIKEGTRAAYRLEVDLLPMVHEMRRRGIRIDQSAAEQARDLLLQKRDAALAELSEQLGARVGMDEIGRNNGRRKPSMHTASPTRARRKAIRRSRPAKPAGCTSIAHWLPQLIATADKYDNAATKFLETTSWGTR